MADEGPRAGVVTVERASVGDDCVVVDDVFGQGGNYKPSVEVECLPHREVDRLSSPATALVLAPPARGGQVG